MSKYDISRQESQEINKILQITHSNKQKELVLKQIHQIAQLTELYIP